MIRAKYDFDSDEMAAHLQSNPNIISGFTQWYSSLAGWPRFC